MSNVCQMRVVILMHHGVKKDVRDSWFCGCVIYRWNTIVSFAFPSSSEFIPYVFQIMSMMLEIHDDCPQPYVELFPFLLNHVLWERHGNIPALTRLVQAFIEKGSNSIIAQDKLVSGRKKIWSTLHRRNLKVEGKCKKFQDGSDHIFLFLKTA